MNAVVISEYGDSDVLVFQEVSIPTPSDNQMLIKVHSYGPNPIDVLFRMGMFPAPDFLHCHTIPYIEGIDGSGVIEVVGKNVTGFKKGDRVFWTMPATGSCAEYCVVYPDKTFLLPDHLSFQQGAALCCPLLTAYRSLISADIKPGDTVLVHGASGAVGHLAVQVAKLKGMKVIGTAGTPAGMEVVKEAGADHVINHRDKNEVEQIMDITNREGVHAIIEMAFSVNGPKNQEVLKKNGTMVIVGSKSYETMNFLRLNPFIQMEHTIRGLILLNTEKLGEWQPLREDLKTANQWLRPFVNKQYPMKEVAKAHDDTMSNRDGGGARGKLVVNIVCP